MVQWVDNLLRMFVARFSLKKIATFLPKLSKNLLTMVVKYCNIQRLIFMQRGVAQFGSALALGARCREFESRHPDHRIVLGL